MKLFDVVTWTSQAGGNSTRKAGEIVEVVPPNVRPGKKDEIKGCGGSRLHESYVVLVEGRYYWPRVSGLKLVRASETKVEAKASSPGPANEVPAPATVVSEQASVASSAGPMEEEREEDDRDNDEVEVYGDHQGRDGGHESDERRDSAEDPSNSMEASMFRPEDGWVVLGHGG